jgi:hypothetical protein
VIFRNDYLFDKFSKNGNAETVKKLPIGIQTFSEIISGNYYYVDKTQLLSELTEKGKYYFLSRPRRFGKSLFLDTLKEAFEGNKELFTGLFLEKNWDWEKKHPVLRIDFGTGVLKSLEELNQRISEILFKNRNKYNLNEPNNKSVSGNFEEMIRMLEKKFSAKVVILVDEYDKPILDNITNKDVAREMRDGLRNFYSVIKSADAHIKFAFLTGVSKFAKVNLFSGLNNLQDITLDERYATICGYTENELSIFQDRLVGVDREKLKHWYNGYNFLGDSVYNPFDILLYLDNKKYKNYWFETGSPAFLIDLIRENKYNATKIGNAKLTDFSLSSFDVDYIQLENLLFQTGYLTIKHTNNRDGNQLYYLKYPNQEVKSSLTDVILQFLHNENDSKETNKVNLYEIMKQNDLKKLGELFYTFFASIPQDWYRKNTLANYEGYYSSIFYCYFTAIGLDVRAEDVTNHGQVDMTVFFENRVYVFEFKVIEMTEAGSALVQIKERRYYEKYISENDTEIYLIGVEFSRDNKNITHYEWEKV